MQRTLDPRRHINDVGQGKREKKNKKKITQIGRQRLITFRSKIH